MNIVESMFKMLEKYSNDLEEIVKDRTEQLEEEKKKTEQLLTRMLPRSEEFNHSWLLNILFLDSCYSHA